MAAQHLILIEFAKLAIGLAVMLFHRPIADYVLEQERSLTVLLHQRGVRLPTVPAKETGRNIYFCIGAFIVLFEIARIWLMLPGLH